MAASTSTVGSKSLKEYLKKYESNTNVEEKKTKKKKKKQPDTNGAASGLIIVDEDPVWQKPVKLEEDEDNDSADEEKPQVDEDIEVRRMKRLEQLRLRRPYNAIAEDGSGWITVDPVRSNTNEPESNISPPRKQRARNDTPSPESELRPSGCARDSADLSPPRKQRTRSDTLSPEPGVGPLSSVRENANLWPPRQKCRDTPSPEPGLKPSRSTGLNSDLSPPRRRRARNDTPSPDHSQKPEREDMDLSPLRQQRRRNGSQSPKRKPGQSAGLASDFSPPRRHGARNDKLSPEPRRKPVREGIDLSPPRQRQRRFDSPSPEPNKGHGQSVGLGSDLSPPRRGRVRSTHSAEPGRKPIREDTDLPPPRVLRKRHHTPSPELNISISRGAQRNSSSQDNDLSPPRKSKKDFDLSPLRKARKEEKGLRRTGLITGNDIREEISKKRDEELLRFQELDPSVTGRGAEAVYRDKIKGDRITKEEYLKSKEKRKEKPEEKKLEWGKGLAQKREAEARRQELELEKDKPFARTRDDRDLDKMLKDRMRWGDPMAHLVKKKHSEPILPDLGENDKMKESGFIIPQEIPSHSWIKRGLDAAPNRYGIRPGRHWDGVDRSNGYEKQLFKSTNEKRATEREAYLWSVADM